MTLVIRTLPYVSDPHQSTNIRSLNWPQWKKDLILVTISLAAAVTGSIGPMISTGFQVVADEYKISIDLSTIILGGSFSIAIGLATFFSTAASVKWGKRPMFIVSMVLLLLTCVWARISANILSLTFSRILQGVAAAPFETLVTSTVADLYFVHERASRLALWGLSLVVGLALSQVGGGYVVQYLGWRQLFSFSAMIFAILLIVILFAVPETAYNRTRLERHPLHDVSRVRAATHIARTARQSAQADKIYVQCLAEDMIRRKSAIHESAAKRPFSTLSEAESRYSDIPSSVIFRRDTANILQRLSMVPDSPHRSTTGADSSVAVSSCAKSHWQSLTIIPRTVYDNTSFWKLVIRPVSLFIYPAVLFSSVINALNYTFLMTFALASLTIFSSEPYFLTPMAIGLTAIPAILAISLAQPIAGILSDKLSQRLTRLNHGMYEPEFRLLGMIPASVFSTIGFLGFGFTVHYQTMSLAKPALWIPLLWYAVIGFSVPFTNVAAFSYLIDSHQPVANEAFVTVHFSKAVLLLLAAGTINGWILKSGVKSVFVVIACVNLGTSCGSIIFWVCGKRMRAWVARQPWSRRI